MGAVLCRYATDCECVKRSLHKRRLIYSLRDIVDAFFRLVEALLQFHLCFFSHSVKPRLLRYQQSLSRCIIICQDVSVQPFNSHMQQNAYCRNLK